MSTALKLPLETPVASASVRDEVARPENGAANLSAGVAKIEIARRIAELGDWFHNFELGGVRTAPQHFLGDFPNVKWKHIAPAIPADLRGKTVLDIGCNGGFYSIEMKRRGAERVLGIDVDDRYLSQARFAAETLGQDIELEKCSVYHVDQVPGEFDFVFFMGVFYHLRYPLYALDKVVKKLAPNGRLVFQTMMRGSEDVAEWNHDYHFWKKNIFEDARWPATYFIEHKYAGDPTNWWVPNRAAAEAMLRSSGLEIVDHPEAETWICAPGELKPRDGQYVFDLEIEGLL